MVLIMKTKQLLKINTGIFGLVALLHLWRAVSGAEMMIGMVSLPGWVSYLAVVIIGGMAWLNYKAE